MTSPNTVYKFIKFTSPRSQAGVVVAYPPSIMCPILPMVVAVAWDLNMENPSVHFMHGHTTVGMLRGVANAITGAQLGQYEDMVNRIGAFDSIASNLGINMHCYPESVQIVVASQELLTYLRNELESYKDV